MNKYILFRLGSESYAIEVTSIQSIENVLPITQIPHTDNFVLGLVNLRGVIVPVIDLRMYLGLPQQQATESSRIIVASFDNVTAGLLVDSATNVIDIPDDDIELSSNLNGNFAKKELKGVASTNGTVIGIIDVRSILVEQNG